MKHSRMLAMAKSKESQVCRPFHGAPRHKVRPYEGLTIKNIKKTQQQLKGKPTTFVLKQGCVPIIRILLDKEEGTRDNFEMIKTLDNAYGGNNSATDGPKIGGGGCDTPTLPANKTLHRKAPIVVSPPKAHPQDICMHCQPASKPRMRVGRPTLVTGTSKATKGTSGSIKTRSSNGGPSKSISSRRHSPPTVSEDEGASNTGQGLLEPL